MVATNDDNMHDPRRPEVPEPDPMAIARDAVAFLRAPGRDQAEAARSLVAILESVYEQGAIAGMQAQYKHNQQRAASQR